MNEAQCEMVRELLPDFVGARLGPADAALVQAHLAACPECAREAALVRSLFAARPAAPAGLVRRMESAARAARRHGYHAWWGVAAASVAAVALGIGVVSHGRPVVDVVDEFEVPEIVAGVEESSLWLADDGLVAGAPTFDGLSDEELLLLLEEMAAGTTGGAA